MRSNWTTSPRSQDLGSSLGSSVTLPAPSQLHHRAPSHQGRSIDRVFYFLRKAAATPTNGFILQLTNTRPRRGQRRRCSQTGDDITNATKACDICLEAGLAAPGAEPAPVVQETSRSLEGSRRGFSWRRRYLWGLLTSPDMPRMSPDCELPRTTGKGRGQ